MTREPDLIDGRPGSHPLHSARTPHTGSIAFPRKWRMLGIVVAEPLAADAIVRTADGEEEAEAGDYLAQAEDGHAWPVKREWFEATYEEIE